LLEIEQPDHVSPRIRVPLDIAQRGLSDAISNELRDRVERCAAQDEVCREGLA
jgi:hypothetical protein